MTLMQMVIAQLTFGNNRFLTKEGERNFFIKSNLTKLLFLNFQTLLNYHKLSRFYENSTPDIIPQYLKSPESLKVRKCFLLDYQNCPKSDLDQVELIFEKMDFKIIQYLNLNQEQTQRLIQEEYNIIAKQQEYGFKSSCLVFCIFADCVANQGMGWR